MSWEMLDGLLWQGSVLDTLTAKQDIILSLVPAFVFPEILDDARAVLNLSTEGRLHVLWPIEDGPLPDMIVATALAALVAHQLALGRTALVQCEAGRNRSGLLCALVLHAYGFGAGPAILARIRERHAEALSNETFAAYVAGLGAA